MKCVSACSSPYQHGNDSRFCDNMVIACAGAANVKVYYTETVLNNPLFRCACTGTDVIMMVSSKAECVPKASCVNW